MIRRIMSKKDVISQLESLKMKVVHHVSDENKKEINIKDAAALNAAIYYLNQRRKEDSHIIKSSLALTFVMLAMIVFIWNVI